VNLRDLGETLRVDEVHPFEIEHENPGAPVQEPANTILERLGGGEEEASIEANHRYPGEGLVGGVLIELPKDLGPRLAPEQRHRRPGRHVDEPDEREGDPDHDPGEHACREGPDYCRDRDPEVEPREPVQAAELGDVDHPEDDRIDDHHSEDGLREMREHRSVHEEGGNDHSSGDER
jgi:hypothetical protein